MQLTKISGPDDPDRCQGVTASGQCTHKAMPGTKKCQIHGGVQATRAIEREKSHDYDIQRYNARINNFADSVRLKTLTGEIAIARMTLERVLDSCENDNDLLTRMPVIMQSVSTVRALIEVLQRHEEKNALLLNRTQVQAIAQGLLGVVIQCVPDPLIRDQIAEGFERVIAQNGNAADANGGTQESFDQ